MIQINTSNEILIDGALCGLSAKQTRRATQVYRRGGPLTIAMPHKRYSLTADRTNPGVAGLTKFEADIRAVLQAEALAV